MKSENRSKSFGPEDYQLKAETLNDLLQDALMALNCVPNQKLPYLADTPNINTTYKLIAFIERELDDLNCEIPG